MTGLVVAAAAACSTEAGQDPELLAPPPATAGTQLVMKAPIAPGEEKTLCQYFVLPDLPGGEDVIRFEHRYTPGSHHLVLLETLLKKPTKEGMFACDDDDVPISDLFVKGVV